MQPLCRLAAGLLMPAEAPQADRLIADLRDARDEAATLRQQNRGLAERLAELEEGSRVRPEEPAGPAGYGQLRCTSRISSRCLVMHR